tara:strand:+ start:36 stop:248 length:213 start_codon:yes stop_codon:yes gene_type:complete
MTGFASIRTISVQSFGSKGLKTKRFPVKHIPIAQPQTNSNKAQIKKTSFTTILKLLIKSSFALMEKDIKA